MLLSSLIDVLDPMENIQIVESDSGYLYYEGVVSKVDYELNKEFFTSYEVQFAIIDLGYKDQPVLCIEVGLRKNSFLNKDFNKVIEKLSDIEEILRSMEE